jgi:hypothetical protein
MTDPGFARQMWHQLEPVHALFWYAPEVFEEAAALGFPVQTRWPSYFAWRAAPLGEASAHLERSTDDLAFAPWQALGLDHADHLAKLTTPLLIAALQSGLFPSSNTLGIGKVPTPTR